MATGNSVKVQIEVVNPVAEVRPKAVMPARRLGTINGKKITLWWNTKSHGEIALNAAAEALQRKFPDATFKLFTRQWAHAPGPYEVVRENGSDAVIASTAD
ncbi:MAG: hypothetical protein HYX92_21770 [Chloroflexi bacterium]|nr:hypothetical protein [Chloroflexota bacterium]